MPLGREICYSLKCAQVFPSAVGSAAIVALVAYFNIIGSNNLSTTVHWYFHSSIHFLYHLTYTGLWRTLNLQWTWDIRQGTPWMGFQYISGH